MRDWLTIELVLAALLVTSFTCVGLLALWAATSPRHWFLRCAIVFGVLSPLLLRSAFEPFVAFVLQSFTVASGVLLYRWRTRPSSQRVSAGSGPDFSLLSPIRFSLSTLLLLIVLAAIVVSIIARLPTLNAAAWGAVVLIGLLTGITTLLGAWMSAIKKRKRYWPVGLILCAAMGTVLAIFDWFIPSITGLWSGWPPDTTNTAAVFGISAVERPILAWFFIILLVPLLTFAFVLCRHVASAPPTSRTYFARATLLLCALLVAAFPAYVLAELLTPDPIPEATLPVPNAYDDFIAAGRIIGTTQFDGTIDVDTATTQQLATEVAKCAQAYALIEAALERPCLAPVDYSLSAGFLNMDNLPLLRDASRALCGRGKLAELNAQHSDSAQSYLQAIRFGYAIRRGGLLVDMLVGIACSGFCADRLYHIRDRLPVDTLQQCIAGLSLVDANVEPYEDIAYRDRVWSQRALGWHGHLQLLLSELVDHEFDLGILNFGPHADTYATHQATMRLLIVELTLAKYHLDHNRWPQSLSQLVPNYLVSIPVDPFAADAHPLRYLRADDGYILYSIGANRIDDKGASPADDFRGAPQTGDLRLDLYFAPDEGQAADGPAE